MAHAGLGVEHVRRAELASCDEFGISEASDRKRTAARNEEVRVRKLVVDSPRWDDEPPGAQPGGFESIAVHSSCDR